LLEDSQASVPPGLRGFKVLSMNRIERAYNNYSILIAEPDREYQRELAHVLSPSGFKTYIAETSSEAMDILDTEAIHLLILDAVLKGMGPFEMLHMVNESFPPLPCILISDYLSKEEQINALLSKVHSVFPKPPNFDLMRETIAHLIYKYYIGSL
jgi:DNA-binding NtrC family response regulator